VSAPRPVAAGLAALCLCACGKVELLDIEAGFTRADAAWFEEEQTLFVFYELSAEQGLGAASALELRWITDTEAVDWTPLAALPQVHTHLPVDCGATALCGSGSVYVPDAPRNVELRLRYHEDGDLALPADTVFNRVGPGDPWSHRSLVVYGVFDEDNTRIQWRGRHQFPTVRNQEAEDLGLRRAFSVEDFAHGSAALASGDNPYAYGVDCPADFAALELPAVQTEERAIFQAATLPAEAAASGVVCGAATVQDATGSFTTPAVARKNPEVAPAFPTLKSPVREAAQLPFFLEPCDRTISASHEAMQRQRLGMEGVASTCTDDWEQPGWVEGLQAELAAAVEAARPAGEDMILVVGLHRDEEGLAGAVEEALAALVPAERHRTTPRLAGAFVFDSEIRGLDEAALEPVTLWCPAEVPTDSTSLPGASALSCAVAPDNPDLELGPLSFGTLPILPSRDQYLDFVATYSESQAGEVLSRSFRVPEFAATADHVDVGDYGVVTFLNGERISADADDAFSYCAEEAAYVFVFRSAFTQSEEFAALVAEQCEGEKLSEDFCAAAEAGVLPVEWLPDWHGFLAEDDYELGIFWQFPYLLYAEYAFYTAGSVSAFGFSVPFGFPNDGEAFLGTSMWTTEEFSLEAALTQCSRFCDHPTFDSAAVYHPDVDFRSSYANSCYAPAYPAPGDDGFPLDP
jgi:hypothetical protein